MNVGFISRRDAQSDVTGWPPPSSLASTPVSGTSGSHDFRLLQRGPGHIRGTTEGTTYRALVDSGH